MRFPKGYLILTNNPLAVSCMGAYYTMSYLQDAAYRDVLVKARDMVYAGYTLYTHPLSGSIKPNETPYRSVVLSAAPHEFSAEQAEIIANAIAAFDKFPKKERKISEATLKDLQLVDYTLLAGAMDFDAAAGLDKRQNKSE